MAMGYFNPYFIKRRAKKWWPYFGLFLLLVIGYQEGVLRSDSSSGSYTTVDESSRSTMKEIFALEREIKLLKSVLKKYSIPEAEYADTLLPIIYVITPTYSRPHQKAELTRLMSVFLHVPSLHWILVEDATHKSKLVMNFLESSGLSYTHLHQSTPPDWKLQDNDPSWRKPRGVLQRNAGIKWLRRKLRGDRDPRGVVYFADDDNTYSTELFKEMRDTKTVSVWPVGLVGGVMVERPLVSRTATPHVMGWMTGWRPDRTFATDMAGFAVNLALLLRRSDAEFSFTSSIGRMESDFLEKLVTLSQLEPKADLCTKVLVWHTRTERPNMKDEERLRKAGTPSDQGIEV
ncbi:hypothetical protein Pmani_033361 [Petrolisthes manimaculis]|uniref:Galactosylgalactosylxylosylprotein 3-beta-glucuronosyltransferase n=1 Tax=Petrolisthes manimaculis TaxID=1843537 RepID=A0AAE1NPL1_9EUCA|nr:hypothetical protein Pmani_039881 [Petrolisthes manimaculis]KAK4293979.1 hypothetical protein Pmani_033361 [Petrolisthes manimaculis]